MRISVITVVRDDPRAARAVASALAQKGVRLQCVVIDGGSTDGTLAALAPWRRRLTLVSEPDRGIYDAMNKGLALARGDVVGFLNADDAFAGPGCLARVAAAFKDSRLQACWADLVIKRPDGSLHRFWEGSPMPARGFAGGWMPAHPTFYARRSALAAAGGFDTRYAVAADYDLMLRLLLRPGATGRYLPGVLVEMETGGASSRGLGAIVRHNHEAWRAARAAGLKVGAFPAFLLRKAGAKWPQLFKRPGLGGGLDELGV